MKTLEGNQNSLKHILWISDTALGDTLHAATWLKTTDELRKMGVRVTLITAGAPDGKHDIRGTEVLYVSRPDVYLMRQAIYHIKSMHLIRKQFQQIDALLFHEISAPWMLMIQVVKKIIFKKKPITVLDSRTLPMQREDKIRPKDRLRANFALLMNGLGNRWFDGRTTITVRMAQALEVPEKKLLGVWPSGVELDQFEKASASRTWPRKGEPIRLVYIGCMHYERNLITLCKAVHRAVQEGMNFHLTIVGDGYEKADLEAYASQLPEIDVLPPVPQNEVVDYLADAHIGVLPFPDELKFQVSSPIKLFEYMASGLPILATDIVCHTDVIGDGKYAFWASSSDEEGLLKSLQEVWGEQDGLEALSKLAIDAAAEWTWLKSAQKLYRALNKGLQD